MTGPSPVLVTGMGVASPLGNGVADAYAAALDGRVGIDRIPASVGADWPVSLWAPVTDELPDVSRHEQRSNDRSVALALQATREAWRQAGTPAVDGERLAVSFSGGMAGAQSIDDAFTRFFGSGTALARTVPRTMPNGPAAALAVEYGAHAGTYSLVSACSSGADAIAHGFRLINSGEADVVITGGAESVLNPVPVLSFNAMRALSQQREPGLGCRPFDVDRDGFVLGEGAAALVLESAAHARTRGAEAIAQLRGVGVTSDGYHLVAPDPSGRQAARAMSRALASAGLAPAGVAAVCAHATGTRVGDAAEASAIVLAFPDDAGRILVTAAKSMVGHLIGAAGPFAAVMAVSALTSGLLHPTPTCRRPDPELRLRVVEDKAASLPAGAVLVDSFGFGGQNVVLCFDRAD